MKLSVIVVNYNMCALLKQSIDSLIKACKHIDYELIVVDDASTDRSVKMLQMEFPKAHTILNEKHLGTAKSRNLALAQASGEYVLMVNADTIAASNALDGTLAFMDNHPDAGGVGVRMLTPQGRFLHVSRRGFNRAWETFFKLTGLAKHFVKSRLYKHKDNNWVDEFETAEVDVINGAFMLLRKSVLNEVGEFDERLSTFGHDIDLSYRIRLAGYKNYYYPKTYILNYRKHLGSKFTWTHIRHFYGAMIIFAAKYMFRMPEIKMPDVPQIFAPKYELEK
ncbi:glycosyltransferase family 2 protein [Mucilaginibacter sp. ZT4R22]|uniref:Glycosyltransferase family 2 protein n=1 Tax=Mucilaginibacter pankratovii TaxID=2772110 RepID=A0ABR7WPZ1_9SPHI|nr:glycosyltransferase family 2 protein [Mucilaginibacter pankratovii]MBD1364266.1 glycosyltransferase family 2 protein [Mucilaginibacter pankratovii]